VMGQFVAAVEGMAEACRAFGVPVVSGNVSFYNETSGQAILPTPTVGMVGVVPEVRHRPATRWSDGDQLFLLGPLEGDLGGSRYLRLVLDLEVGPIPAVDFAEERRLSVVVRDLVRLGLVAAKDIADGGLGVAMVEMSRGEVGALLEMPDRVSLVRVLFGEWLGRFLLAAPAGCGPAVERACTGLPLTHLGTAGGSELVVTRGGKTVLRRAIGEFAARREAGMAWLTRA